MDSTQKAQKIQNIKPKTSPKTSPKFNKSNSNIHEYEETQYNSQFCRSPRRYNVNKNETDENNDFVFYWIFVLECEYKNKKSIEYFLFIFINK